MALNNMSGLKVAGLAVALVGVFALLIVAAPVVRGQSVKYRPFTEIRTQIFGGMDIGVIVRDIDEADVKREKLASAAGAVVEDVRADSPAAKAGVKAGDVIVSFDGERIRSAKHFSRLVEETPEGREVDATVIRAGEQVTLKVAPAAIERWRGLGPFAEVRKFSGVPRKDFEFVMPKLEGRPFAYSFFDRSRGRLGIGVQDLTEQLGDYFGTPTGALVTAVDDGTPAKTAGLKAGDVITKINGEQVRSAADLQRRLGSASGDVSITVMRDRKEMTVKAKLERDAGRVMIR